MTENKFWFVYYPISPANRNKDAKSVFILINKQLTQTLVRCDKNTFPTGYTDLTTQNSLFYKQPNLAKVKRMVFCRLILFLQHVIFYISCY